MRRASVALAMLMLAGCSASGRGTGVETENLPDGVAARVENEIIHIDAVREVARTQGITLVAARERLIGDALLAVEARAVPGRAQTAERTALARIMLEQFEARARGEISPSDADIERVTSERWWELDRPASARTAHVAVLVKTPGEEPRARAVADAIATAAHGVVDSRELFARAHGVPRDGLEIRGERLPAVAADGRVVPLGEPRRGDPTQFDVAFAEAANAIEAEGGLSPVVRSTYGFHVILLEEKRPERRPSLEERRALVKTHLVRERARALLDREIARLRGSTTIDVSRAAETLTARIGETRP